MGKLSDFDFPISQSFAEFVEGPRVVRCVCEKGGVGDQGNVTESNNRITRLETNCIVLEQTLSKVLAELHNLQTDHKKTQNSNSTIPARPTKNTTTGLTESELNGPGR